MPLNLAYGRHHLPLTLTHPNVTVIQPRHSAGLPDEKTAIFNALEHPIDSPPLRDWIKPGSKVCITFSDITRATPNDRLIPWLLEYLHDIPPDHITLINQLGTHRPNTHAELETLLTPEVVRRYHVLNHEPENPDALVQLGTTGDGTPALLNRHLVEADVRIITGFIEPHFFAGFSGGPKGIVPGCGGLHTIMSNHGTRNISHPNATFGITHGNPLWEELHDIAQRPGPSFLLNVTLNDQRAITGVFAGNLLSAHQQGTAFVKDSAMQAVPHPYDIVITSNSGYPLDLNLYQGVKGLSAAARIVRPGGLLILACECSEGIPANSPFDQLLRSNPDPHALLHRLAQPGHHFPEQWQAQILAQIQQHARVMIHSTLTPESLHSIHLTPCQNIESTVHQELQQLGPNAQIAVLPYGPLTIPYIAN
ncbi:MAG: nickel-dependent lactate racemase [Limisphaerales bacterium]|jgi:nickel-dependent lactate racemase